MPMSERTDLVTPAPIMTDDANSRPPAPLAQLDARDLGQLLIGFNFLFWGLLALLAAVTESLVAPTVRAFWVVFIGAGSLAISAGAWRLHRVNHLGAEWHRRTRDLLIAAVLAAYLSLFYVVWRQYPRTLYFLLHAVAFAGVVIGLLSLLCMPVAALARAANRRNLAFQCVAFGTIAVVLLVPVFALVAQAMVAAARQGQDPFLLLQTWILSSRLGLLLLGLLPFSLTLSLLWSAKDLVWERLDEMVDEPGPPAA